MEPLHVLALVASCLLLVDGQSSCITPSGGEGTCQSITDCEPLLALSNNKYKTAAQSDVQQKSSCGSDGGVEKVCCPNPCRNPDGAGECANVNAGRHLAGMKASKQGDRYYSENSKDTPTPQEVPTHGCAAIVTAMPPDPSSDCCGIENSASNRIRGGIDAEIDQYPWLVLIEYVQKDQVFTSCGGTLISSKYVLTAAHCVHGRLIYGPAKNIRLGEYDTSNEGPDSFEVEPGYFDYTDGAIVIPIESILIHPAYTTAFNYYSASRHDIALIRMTRPAPYTDFIRPICLPSVDQTLSPPENFTLYAAGWGAVSDEQKFSNIKQHVALPYVDIQTCQSKFNLTQRYADLWDGQICAGGEPDKDSCKGDSGGPLMHVNNRITEVTGVVSFGHGMCGTAGIPAVYTKVVRYVPWIKKNIVL